MLEFLNHFFKELKKELIFQINNIFDSNDLFNWKWFLLAFGLAFIIYAIRLKSFRRVIHKTLMYSKQSRFQSEFIKDLKFLLLKTFYKPLVISLFAFNVHHISKTLTLFLKTSNIKIPTILNLDPHLGSVFKLILVMMVYDFAYYIVHYLQHKYTPIWLFHKVHHRATSLNPFTKLRIHPFEYFFNYSLQACIGTPIIFFITSFYSIPNDKPLYVYVLIAMVIGRGLAHLRHSHIRIHYGILSYIFISPVMHQVHHSTLEKHHNKNLSTLFSFWDLIFGTFYLPKKNEYFKFGVPDYKNQIPSVTEELILPFKELYSHYNLRPINPAITKPTNIIKIKENQNEI